MFFESGGEIPVRVIDPEWRRKGFVPQVFGFRTFPLHSDRPGQRGRRGRGLQLG